jgi:hypothetical protein
MTTSTVHPFERAGLGHAPYRCYGCRENRFEMPGFGWKPGGSCDYCGTGILYEYVIKSADGVEFVVGCDCVNKTGADVLGFKEERTRIARERRQTKVAARRAIRQAEWAAIREKEQAERSAAFWATFGDLGSKLQAYSGDHDFLLTMKQALADRGYLTERMISVVESNLDRLSAEEALRASSRHIGVIGKRVKGIKAKVVFSKHVGNSGFYPFPPKFIVRFLTEDGSVLVWFTSHGESISEELETISFSVKDHGEYNQTKQTIVQRVTFTD